ncbi:hypothetical protein IKP85_06990 [bacterium]|nr:hypothetical protein [bacterium]
MKKSSNSIKNRLLVSALVPLAIIGISSNSADAEDIYAPVPTLTKLHNEGAVIPDTDPAIVYPNSSYSIVAGSEDDYSYKVNCTNEQGENTTNYYKINSQLDNINVSNYTLPNGYSTHGRAYNDNSLIDINVLNVTFQNISEGLNVNGAALNNTGTISNIIADFVNNQTSGQGGAIYNSNSGIIDYIDGNFIGNSAKGIESKTMGASGNGGAIYNEGKIGKIIGNIVNNSATSGFKYDSSNHYVYLPSHGGAIYNIGNIGDIFANFKGNYAVQGGAIYNNNYGRINNIIGDFYGNNIVNNGIILNIEGDFLKITSSDGAIDNTNRIDNITGNFIANNIAVQNEGTIKNITGNFIANTNGAIKNNSSSSSKTINNITNSSFYNNNGGAINSKQNINIVADNGTSSFKDNYIGEDKTAIYMTNASTLTFETKNNGSIYVYDDIDGTTGYKVKVTSDGTGSFNLYGNINNANLDMENASIDSANGKINDFNFNTLTSDATTNYKIDINLSGDTPTSDTFTTGETSSGTITISDINYNGAVKDFKVQVLNAQNDNIQLAIGDNLAGERQELGTTSQESEDTISASAKWNDKFQTYTQTGTSYGTVNTATTSTTNDSIELKVTDTEWGEKVSTGSLGDTLALVNQLETTEDRSFTFDTANDKYNVSSDLGTTTAGKFSVNGVSNGENRSEINLNAHKGFELDNATTLNLNDVRLTGNNTLITVNNQNAVVNLQNANINGSIASNNSYTLNINGDTSDRTIINGTVGNANATLNGGEVKFNTDTFEDAEFSAVGGTVDLVTGQVENYDIGKLTSDESTNWIFEINADGSGADTLTVGTGSSGTVNVSEINFLNGDSPSNEFTVQLLNAEDDNIQLALDSSISGENHKIGTTTKTSQDTVTPTAKWNQTFNKYTQNGTNYGNIDVATTNTTNDSLQLQITSTEWDDKVVSGSMGDTLALVNQLETEENRNFNFDKSSNVYNVKSDLGTSSEGVMNVNGVYDGNVRSTIKGNNYNMFVLSNPTTLNLNNVKVTGANSVASGTNKSAVINMKNVELSNNASGITTAGSVNISGKSLFKNNGNGIEVTSDDSIITLNGIDGDGYDVTFKDRLKGVSGAKLNLKAGQVEFHKSVTDLDINMDGTTANLKADNVFNGQNLTVASASNISMINNSVGTMHLNSLTLHDNMNLGVDVDLANKSMDRISADSYNLGEHKVNVNKMNLLSDAKEVRTDIEFADENLRNNVTTSVSEVAYSPIYKYGVKYNQDNGEFQFTRSNSGGGGGGDKPKPQPQPQPTYDDLNPAIMAAPVAAQLGGYAGMLDNYGNALNHMDMYMLKPAHLRAAERRANQYAIADGSPTKYYSTEANSTGIWVRPYTSYDSVGLKHGPKVHNLSYGSFIGGDFGMHDFGNGLYGEFSPYISYQGAHQHYSGNSVYQNGGTLGFTGTLYKGNFFTGLTAGVGANVTEASTMYGNEDFPMLTTGVASKTGYNIEFKDGKFIIQPSLLVSYTFVNTFDYKNGADVRIDTAPLHAIQINPNIRFSFNTKNYWQPYAFVGMNWNIMDSGHFKAADTTLPELSMKPYVQYGLGIQKLFSDNFTAFAQVAMRNGGRNGIGGTLGMKWILGGQPQKQEEESKQKNEL